MAEPQQAYDGETSRRYRCINCGKRSKFERDADERTVEHRPFVTHKEPSADMNPPLLPTTYRCPRCGHRRSSPPVD